MYDAELTGVRTGSGGHKEVSVSPDLPVLEIALDGGSSDLVGNGISSVSFNSLDGPCLLLGTEESALLWEVDNEEESRNTEDNGDQSE